MRTSSSRDLGKRIRRVLVSYVAACHLMGATFAGVFLYDQAVHGPFGSWWDPLFVILFGPLIVPIVVFGIAADWFIEARPGVQTVWWPVPVFVAIWAGCFMLIGRLMGLRDRVSNPSSRR